MFFISNEGMIEFGIVLSLLFIGYWLLAIIFCKNDFLKIREANTALIVFFFGFIFMVFEKINHDYLNTSLFCQTGDPRRLEFDISWPCDKAFYAENTIVIFLILCLIFSICIRVYFSRKDTN